MGFKGSKVQILSSRPENRNPKGSTETWIPFLFSGDLPLWPGAVFFPRTGISGILLWMMRQALVLSFRRVAKAGCRQEAGMQGTAISCSGIPAGICLHLPCHSCWHGVGSGKRLAGPGLLSAGQRLPFFAQEPEYILILKKYDVFVDKTSVFVYLHLRVGM